MTQDSTITCPQCRHQTTERMPTDACQFFYECKGCGERLEPLPGDCCVFCSYGTVPCPPIQAGLCCTLDSIRNYFGGTSNGREAMSSMLYGQVAGNWSSIKPVSRAAWSRALR